MAKGLHQINNYLESLISNQSLAELREKISPSSGESYPSIVSLKGVTRWFKDGAWVEIDARRNRSSHSRAGK